MKKFLHYILVKYLSLFLILTMLFTALPGSAVVYAKKSSSDKTEKERESSSSKKKQEEEINRKIKESEDQMGDAEDEKKKLQSGMDQVKQIISGLQSTKNNLEGYVKELDSNLASIQNEINSLDEKIDGLNEEIDKLNGKIHEKEKEIEQAKQDVSDAKDVLDKQYEDTREHLKYMYQSRTTTFLDVLLGAGGIQDFLNRAEYVTSMADYDNDKLDEYAHKKAELEEKEEILNNENKELQELKSQVEATKTELAGEQAEAKVKGEQVNMLISAKEKEIDNYEADISSKEAQVKEYQDMIAAQDAIIRSLESAIAEQRRRLENGDEDVSELPSYDGGKFTFPAPSYTRVSDDYGNRIHPTLGVNQFHNGIDLAAPSGSPILAAYDGSVIAADYSSTMGNYIMLDHGDGLFTIYMHASSLLVSKGNSVSRGQKIALVGSTGRSTGPHLHFSVRLNGNYVSPWNYLK